MPSFATDESSHSASYTLNVGNLRDTGHLSEVTPPTAMADDLPVMPGLSTVASSAEAADGDLADYFRYGFVTGHRPGNLTERQLSDFLCGRTRPRSDSRGLLAECPLMHSESGRFAIPSQTSHR